MEPTAIVQAAQPDFLSQFLQNLLLALLPILAASAATWLLAKARQVWAQFKATKPDLATELESIARTVVMAAEQAGASQLIKNKKDYAIQMAQNYLALKGLKIDLPLIDAAIEAAVYEVINSQPGGKLYKSSVPLGDLLPDNEI